MEARQRAMAIPAVTLWASDDFSVPRFPQLSSVVIIHLLHVAETSTCGKSTWTQTCGKGSYTEHHLNSLCLAHDSLNYGKPYHLKTTRAKVPGLS